MKTYKTKHYTITIGDELVSFWRHFDKSDGMAYNNSIHSFKLSHESISAFIELLDAELENGSTDKSST